MRLDWALQSYAAKEAGYWYVPPTDVPPALVSWVDKAKVSVAIADAFNRSSGLETLRGSLKSRKDIADVVCSPSVLEAVVSTLCSSLQIYD